MKKIVLAVLGGTLFVTPAAASTYLGSTPGPDVAIPAGLLTIDFNAANQLSDIQGLSGNGQIVQGFLPGVYAQPFGDTTKYLSVPQSGGGGTATLDLTGYDFGGTVDGFSFYWGSIDTYNSLVVNTSQGSITYAFNGQNPPPPANGAQFDAANNRRVYFGLAGGETLNSLQFVSSGYAMEIDDLVFTGERRVTTTGAVPEPATWATLLGGFGLVGGSLRSARRRGAKLRLAAA
jgi:hypothetical protein